MAPKLVRFALVAACTTVAAAGGCGDDGDDDDATAGPGAVCPVPPSVVEEAIDGLVEVGEDATPDRCTYAVVVQPPATDDEPGRFGARVVVDVRALDDGDYGRVLEVLERRSGPTESLAAGEIDGAARGWVATAGRAVSVGAANSERLAQIVVLDPTLDSAAAREAALRIADEVLG